MEGNNNGGTWPSPQDRQNQDWKNTPAIGTGEGESPLMKQQTDVRTMSSDASSIQPDCAFDLENSELKLLSLSTKSFASLYFA